MLGILIPTIPHSWGDGNGQVMENLIEMKDLVCLYDGRGTRIDVATGKDCLGPHSGISGDGSLSVGGHAVSWGDGRSRQ